MVLGVQSNSVYMGFLKISILYRFFYISMYVCMYVCMYGCMYVCMYVCMYIQIHLETEIRNIWAPRRDPLQ